MKEQKKGGLNADLWCLTERDVSTDLFRDAIVRNVVRTRNPLQQVVLDVVQLLGPDALRGHLLRIVPDLASTNPNLKASLRTGALR